MATLGQKWAFVRHIPLHKLLARGMMRLQRAFETRLPPHLPSLVTLAQNPPLPIFAARNIDVKRNGEHWQFRFLGHGETMAGMPDWQRHGQQPAMQLWQMNLHYMEYLEALDPTECLLLMRSWIAANPPFTRQSWHDAWNSYTLSLRSLVWMQRIAQVPELAQADIIASLATQIHFLERHLEQDLGGNHLIKNIKALIWASAFFDGPAAKRWHALGTRLLARELPRQILADGVHFERSPSYHAQVLADLLEIRHALGGDPAGLAIEDTLTAMTKAALALSHRDGGPALLGDAGMTMAYSPAECAQAYTKVTAEDAAQGQHFAFAEAGYFGIHNPDYSLIADMGRVGPDDLPAHAHGDIGSFELSLGDQRFIVDQGVYEYVEGQRRDQSRASPSHNCLTIGGMSQADFFGAFRCGRRPDAIVTHYHQESDGFTLAGHHNGYRHAVVHRRFTATPQQVEIYDRVEGDASGAIEIGLLIHPDCTVVINGSEAEISCGPRKLLIKADFAWMVAPAVYWPDMGVEVQTKRLRLTLPPSCRESSIVLQILSANNQEYA